MNYAELTKLLQSKRSPVVLLEGTRELPEQQAPYLTALAAHLARSFPHARFRTGNAKGSDEAFAAGITNIDATRLEYVLPYPTHRSSHRPPEAAATAIEQVPSSRVQEIVEATIRVSPQYQRVAVNYRERRAGHRGRSVAQMILRDTLKVTGTGGMRRPAVGIFYVNLTNPDRGGTGHTMRVCREQRVPVVTQFDWMEWPFEQ